MVFKNLFVFRLKWLFLQTLWFWTIDPKFFEKNVGIKKSLCSCVEYTYVIVTADAGVKIRQPNVYGD